MLTTKQAAAVLGVQPQTVAKLINRGLLVATHFGRDWMIDPAEVERYQHERRHPGRQEGLTIMTAEELYRAWTFTLSPRWNGKRILGIEHHGDEYRILYTTDDRRTSHRDDAFFDDVTVPAGEPVTGYLNI